MENPVDICKRNLGRILELIQDLLKKIGESPLTRAEREAIKNFEINYKNFNMRTTASSIDVEAAITSASGAAVHAQALGTSIGNRRNVNIEILQAAKLLQSAANSFRDVIDSGEEFTAPYVLSVEQNPLETPVRSNESITSHEKNIIELQARLRSEIETFERDITKGAEEIEDLKRKSFEYSQKSQDEVSALRSNIEHLKSEISGLQDQMIKEAGKAAKISEDAEQRSNEVNTQIDGLLGQTASKVLLVDYANTAETEGKAANTLRGWSLACMGMTGIILCFALYESISGGLDWKQAIFRVVTAIALSVPAAYLARESAKHRSQEHVNRRISLDLRAITPYIATLPSEEQNKIKSEVASKIFGMQEAGSASTDNYPINIQELAKMLIEKIPTPK
ncbi:hypothetical protein [Pseudomonas sp. SDT291_1_S447]|jgi:FtsZ-binding cell division protein ZapB